MRYVSLGYTCVRPGPPPEDRCRRSGPPPRPPLLLQEATPSAAWGEPVDVHHPLALNCAHARVTLALRLLFGLEPGIDGERLDDGTHVLDA